jgi:gluconolactonase
VRYSFDEVLRFLSLLAFTVRLGAQDFSHIAIERVAVGLRFAEGPAWSYEGFLVFSDSGTDRLRKVVPGSPDSDFAERPGGVMGNAYDREGRLYSCEPHQRRVTRTLKDGKIEIVAARFEGKRFNAPNDIVVRRDGQVFFTDPAFGAQQDARELDFYGIYHVSPRGEMDVVARWKTRPNGIALSPNGRVLYVSDSDQRKVRAYDLDGKGVASNERVILENLAGVPGGIRVDEKGNLYIAAKSIFVYSPPSGTTAAKLLGEVPVGEPPSNLAFGDPDLETLYITARTSLYRVRLGVKGALPY